MPDLLLPGLIFFNARLAVDIFFVLSGDALSAPYFASKDYLTIHKMVLKRYLRLTMPILFSCLLVWGLMEGAFTYHKQAAVIVHREDWLGVVLPFEPNILDSLMYALVQVYTDGSVKNSYNPVLWTISVELYGSVIIFLYLYCFFRLRYPLVVTSVLFIAFYICLPHLSAFLCGVFFGIMRSRGVYVRLSESHLWQIILTTNLVLIILFQQFVPAWLWHSDHYNVLQAAALVFLFYSLNYLRRLFKTRISIALGDISYPLYVLHFPVLVSFTSYLIVAFHASNTLSGPIVSGIILSSIAVSLGLATVFRIVERIYLKKVDGLVNRLIS